jgi:hypothetical protein
MPACRHIDNNEFVRNLLLGESNEDPAGIARKRMVVQLDSHSVPNPMPLSAIAQQRPADDDGKRRVKRHNRPIVQGRKREVQASRFSEALDTGIMAAALPSLIF